MEKKHIITLGGYPGSGKSTVRTILAERLGYRKFSTGDFVRELAARGGLTLEAFNEMVSESKETDLMIDAELMRIEREENNYIVDSHLAFHFIPSGFSVFLNISLETSAERVFNDKHSELRIKAGEVAETLEEALLKTQKRIKNHEERYCKHYGVDPYIPSQFAFVIDTEYLTPEEVSEEILKAYERWLAE